MVSSFFGRRGYMRWVEGYSKHSDPLSRSLSFPCEIRAAASVVC